MIEKFFDGLRNRKSVRGIALVDNSGEIRDIYVRSRNEGTRLTKIVGQILPLLAVSERIDKQLNEAILVLDDAEIVVFNQDRLVVILTAEAGEDISLLRLYLEVSIQEMLTHRRIKRKLNKWPPRKSDYFLPKKANAEDMELLQKFLKK